MSAQLQNSPQQTDPWQLARRIESWAGEIRVNLIRLLAILLFYGRHVIEMLMSPADAPVRGMYHLRITLLAITWGAAGIALHILLIRRIYPPAMKFLTVLVDLLLTTVLCMITANPRTPLLLLYFVVIATAPLRLSRRLIYVATGGAMAGYLCTLGYYAWHLIGFDRYYSSPELRVPRSEEAIVLLAMLTAGLLAGQSVREARRLVHGYPIRPVEQNQGR